MTLNDNTYLWEYPTHIKYATIRRPRWGKFHKSIKEWTGKRGALMVGAQNNGEIFVLRGKEFTQIHGFMKDREECRKHWQGTNHPGGNVSGWRYKFIQDALAPLSPNIWWLVQMMSSQENGYDHLSWRSEGNLTLRKICVCVYVYIYMKAFT